MSPAAVGGGTRVGFARWRSGAASGGNRYDEQVAAGLRALGIDVHDHAVTGSWPLPEQRDRHRVAGLLRAEQEWLVGNIVGSAVPDVVASAVASGRRVTLLVHYFPADDPALSRADRERLAVGEAAVVRAATRVVVTSGWAAREVATRYGRTDAVVAVPGVDPAAVAAGSSVSGGPPCLLWLARLTHGKDPLTFLEALARCREHRWTARLVGPDTVDPGLGREVRARITSAGLAERVEVSGPRHGAALEAAWAATDLLVHTSRAETYGMVVSEALARGIPSIVSSGTGAEEAQRAGATFPPGDPAALAALLSVWLSDPHVRSRWRAEAMDQRARVPTWSDTARAVAAALTG